MKNIDSFTHTRGESIYLDDIPLVEGTLFGAAFGSPVAHGKILNLDLSEAEKVKDVIKIFTYKDIPGFCKSATTDEIAQHSYVLTPGRYVGAKEIEDEGEPFEEKMARLTNELHAQFGESAKLEQAIKANLSAIGYGD